MEAPTVSPELRKGRNRLAVTVVVGHAVKHIYNSGLQTILLPEIKIGLDLSATELGSLAFSRRAAGWVTTIGAGYVGDRFANRAALMLGVAFALMGASYFFAGSAPNYWIMLIAMLAVGIGPSLYHPPAIGALSRRFPDKRGFAISLHGTGGSVGEVLGPLVVAGALSVLVWQDVLRLSMFPALIGAVLIWGMMRSIPGDVPGSSSTRAYLASVVKLLRKRALLVLVVITALRSMGQSATVIFLPVYLREDLGFSVARVAIYLSMAQVMGIAVQPGLGFLSDRYGRKAVLIPTMLALGLLIISLRFAAPGAQLVLAVLGVGAFLYSLHVIFIAAAMDVAEGEVQSTVVAVIYSANFLGTVSPLLAGIIADAHGVSNAFLYAGGMVLVGTVVMSLMRLPRTANQASALGADG